MPRRAEIADAAAVAAVQVIAWQAGYRDIMPASHLASIGDGGVERWNRILIRESAGDRRGSRTYVVEDAAGVVVGISTAGPAREETEPGLGELWMLNVAPQAWGTGVAVRLHDYALDRLRDSGFGDAILWVVERNARARRFYERSGWRPDGGAKTVDVRGFSVPEVRYRIAL